VADISEVASGGACRLAPEGRPCPAHNEEAFHYFLDLERRRADRSHRPLLLVLTSLVPRTAHIGWRMDPALAQKLFTGLWLCTRDADVIGWYREGRVAGAVLTQCSNGSSNHISRPIRARVTDALGVALPRSVRQTLRVHVYQLMPRIGDQVQVPNGAIDRL